MQSGAYDDSSPIKGQMDAGPGVIQGLDTLDEPVMTTLVGFLFD